MNTPPRHHRRHNGKVARLPEPTRERINVMLDDGFRYRQIIQALGPPGTFFLPYPISEMNLSNWFHGGHKDYLRHKQYLESQRAHPWRRPGAAMDPRCYAASTHIPQPTVFHPPQQLDTIRRHPNQSEQ
jgi:hypothetical protein